MGKLTCEEYDIILIEQQFWNRINYTNIAYEGIVEKYNKKNKDDLNEEDEFEQLKNLMYFKYYFDISTAIEALLRGIAFGMSSKHNYVHYYTRPYDPGKGYFISLQELETFIDFEQVKKIFNNFNDFKDIFRKISPLNDYKSWNKSFDNIDFFRNAYKGCYDQRNLFAHGLAQKNSNATADFTTDRLMYFIYLYYFFVEYYKNNKELLNK